MEMWRGGGANCLPKQPRQLCSLLGVFFSLCSCETWKSSKFNCQERSPLPWNSSSEIPSSESWLAGSTIFPVRELRRRRGKLCFCFWRERERVVREWKFEETARVNLVIKRKIEASYYDCCGSKTFHRDTWTRLRRDVSVNYPRGVFSMDLGSRTWLEESS